MWDDFDPLLDTLADTLRPAPGVLPDQPSDDELLALRTAVDERFPTSGWRAVGGRRPLPTVIGAAAAALLFSTASVAAAATSVTEPIRLAQTFAHEIGLPVTDPNVDDAHSTLQALTVANAHHDAKQVARQIGKLRAELRRLNADDRSALMRQITRKSPAIAAQLTNAPGPIPIGGTATAPTGTTLPIDSGTKNGLVKTRPTDPPTSDPNGKTIPTDPSTTLPPDSSPSTTLPPSTDTTTTVAPTTTLPADTTTTVAPATTLPPDTTTTLPPDTTTTIPQQAPTGTTTTSIP